MPTRHAAILKKVLLITLLAAALLAGIVLFLSNPVPGDGLAQRTIIEQRIRAAFPNADHPDNGVPALIAIAAELDERHRQFREVNMETARREGRAQFGRINFDEIVTPTPERDTHPQVLRDRATTRAEIERMKSDDTLARIGAALDAPILDASVDPSSTLPTDYRLDTWVAHSLATIKAASAVHALTSPGATPDADAALDHLEDVQRLATIPRRSPTHVDQLIADGYDALALVAWRRHTTVSNTTPMTIHRANTLFASRPSSRHIAEALETERIIFHQLIDITHDRRTGIFIPAKQRDVVFEPESHDNADLHLPHALNILGLAYHSRDTALAITNDLFSAVTAALNANSAAERDRLLADARDQVAAHPTRQSFLIGEWLPETTWWITSFESLERERRLTLLHNAALLHEHNTGEPPTSTADLTRNNLIDPELLADPTNDQPLTLEDLDQPRNP